jgi:hypothetical protein
MKFPSGTVRLSIGTESGLDLPDGLDVMAKHTNNTWPFWKLELCLACSYRRTIEISRLNVWKSDCSLYSLYLSFDMCCQTECVNLQRTTCTNSLVILSLTVRVTQSSKIFGDTVYSPPFRFSMYDLGCRENWAAKLIYLYNLIVFMDTA